MSAMYEYGRRLVTAKVKVDKLRQELGLSKGVFLAPILEIFSSYLLELFTRLNFCLADLATEAEQNMRSSLSRISDLEKELEFAKKSNEELET